MIFGNEITIRNESIETRRTKKNVLVAFIEEKLECLLFIDHLSVDVMK